METIRLTTSFFPDHGDDGFVGMPGITEEEEEEELPPESHKKDPLAVVERSRRKQASRINWLKSGDACTRFFHLKMSARRRRK